MMKKNIIGLATGLFMIGMIGVANATIIGHDVVDRAKVDSWTNFSMIDYSMQLTDVGTINSWSVFAERTGSVYLQTYRHTAGSTYEVVGENYFEVTATGVNTFSVAENDRIGYQENDYIGWTFTSPAVISYDVRQGGSVDWAPVNGLSAVGIGSTMTFDSSQDRVYSISAETASVPEPSAMLLFGSGIAGLVGTKIRRKKKK